MFPFCGRCCLSAVSHPQQYSIATMDTVVPMNIEVPTKQPVSHNDRIVVLEIRHHSESPMLYRPALRGNWSALSLARRALKDKFSTLTVPLTAALPNRQVFVPNPIFIHLSFLHKTGSNNPLGVNKNTDKIQFHPYFTVKDIVGFAMTIIILTVLTPK